MSAPASARTFQGFAPGTIPLDRTSLVEASAGTGKTYSITLLYLRSLLEKRLDTKSILVVTFTRAATAELRHRIRDGVRKARLHLEGTEPIEDPVFHAVLAPFEREGRDGREAALRRLESALDTLDRASIFTIDGFFQRIVAQHAFEAGLAFDAELLTDLDPLRQTIADDLYTSRFAHASLEDFRTSAVRSRKTVAALVKAAIDFESLPVSPAAPPEGAVEDARRAFVSACATYRAARERSGPDDVVLRAVKRVRPRIKGVKALSGFDRIARHEDAVAKLPDSWEYVSEGALREEAAKGKGAYEPLPVFAAVDDLVSALEALHRTSRAFESNAIVSGAKAAFRARTTERGVFTFGAVKATLESLLRDPARGRAIAESLASTYGIALVDECQDTDEAQLSVFDTVFSKSGRPLLFIGDPKQAIYRFRGADVHAYLAARDRAAGLYTMGRNFRSTPAVVDTLDALYRDTPRPFGDIDIDFPHVTAAKTTLARFDDRGSKGAVEVLFVPPKIDALEACATDVGRALATAFFVEPDGTKRPLRPHDVAVLTRSNAQVDALCRGLRARGIPAVASSNRSVLGSEEAAHFLRFLGAVIEPGNARRVRAALLTPLFGYTPRALAALRDDAAWDAILDRLLALRDALVAYGPSQAFATFAREEKLEARLLRRPDGFRFVTNLAHVVELATRVAAERRLGPEGVLAWLERARAGEVDETGAEERGLRLEQSGDAVQVLTVHKSKGLEYGLTYVVGVTKRRKAEEAPLAVNLPGEGDALVRALVTDLGSVDGAKERVEAETQEEDARLAYVAMTRAVHGLRIVAKAAGANASKDGLPNTAIGRILAGDVPMEKGTPIDGDPLFAHLEARFAQLALDPKVSLGVRKLDDVSNTPFQRADVPPVLVAPARLERTFEGTPRTSSFSGLVAGAEHARPDDRDRRPGDPNAERAIDDPLAELAGGSQLGIVVHDLLETIDFDASDDAITAHVEARTKKADSFAHAVPPLAEAVRRVLATPLLEGGPRLADIPRARTLRELEFHLAVGHDTAFDAAALGALFTEHAIPLGDTSYGASVAALRFDALRGFLHGFVDLVFEHDGRFYVVDHKSNRLGAEGAYATSALVDPMKRSHYVLQYALYLVALHRLLRRRLRDYDYDVHVGGALYLFVRGMDPGRGPSSGVYFERPPRAFVEALDALLDGRRPA